MGRWISSTGAEFEFESLPKDVRYDILYWTVRVGYHPGWTRLA